MDYLDYFYNYISDTDSTSDFEDPIEHREEVMEIMMEVYDDPKFKSLLRKNTHEEWVTKEINEKILPKVLLCAYDMYVRYLDEIGQENSRFSRNKLSRQYQENQINEPVAHVCFMTAVDTLFARDWISDDRWNWDIDDYVPIDKYYVVFGAKKAKTYKNLQRDILKVLDYVTCSIHKMDHKGNKLYYFGRS